jgi:hypothetical protein
MDYILDHLENAKKKPSHNNAPYLTACVNLGWRKLDQYYLKTDLNPAYIMAVFLHPQYKLGWFGKHWCESEQNKALAYVQEQYNLAKSKHTRPQVSHAPQNVWMSMRQLCLHHLQHHRLHLLCYVATSLSTICQGEMAHS